jgi:oxygen-dependent protoporphyrinogen oxidase
MYGGAVDPETAGLPEDELLILAREEMSRLYRLTAPPVFEHVAQWPRAIPQYEMGHLERVARIERRIAALPGFFLCGNGLYGVAFADAAESGIRAGERAARWLAATPLP